MKLTNTQWLIGLTTLLIISKIFPLYHINLSDTSYLDIDRTVALVFFIGFYIKYLEPLSLKQAVYTSVYLVAAIVLNEIFDITSLERLVVLFFLTAMVEEILLRGVLFELLLKKFSWPAVLLGTSIFFTAVHPAVYSNATYTIAVLFTGIVLGAAYLSFRNESKALGVVHATGAHIAIILLGLATGVI